MRFWCANGVYVQPPLLNAVKVLQAKLSMFGHSCVVILQRRSAIGAGFQGMGSNLSRHVQAADGKEK